ncbi:MAG TPA: hypothetical protein VEJ18_06130 [Planctomycetota bacterium]|nr:hypothetical protein [Planctomycetota bacterium]
MTCPQCGRALAAGARTCVYCAHGAPAKRRDELQVPRSAMAPRKKPFPWGKIVFVLLVVGAGLALLQPQVRAQALALLAQIKSYF